MKEMRKQKGGVISSLQKFCSKCCQYKPLIQFSKCHTSIDGLDYRCKQCVSSYQKNLLSNFYKHRQKLEYARRWRDKNREYKRMKDREYIRRKLLSGKLLGTGNICSHRNPDFKKEIVIVHNERDKILSKGCAWIYGK